MNPNKNWNCDNDKCRHSDGEVRLLPTSPGLLHGNMILCYDCYCHEVKTRKDAPNWDTLKIYKPE
jgi:hypothetical protein